MCHMSLLVVALPCPKFALHHIIFSGTNTNFCIISNNIEVYEEPVPLTKKIPHCAVEF